MNPLLKAAAESVTLGWLMGLMTALFLACFLFWTWWAYRPAHKRAMDEAARLPLTDGGTE